MYYNHLPPSFDQFEEPGIDLETAIICEFDFFDPWAEMMIESEKFPDYHIMRDDYLQKELERNEQEKINAQYQPKIP